MATISVRKMAMEKILIARLDPVMNERFNVAGKKHTETSLLWNEIAKKIDVPYTPSEISKLYSNFVGKFRKKIRDAANQEKFARWIETYCKHRQSDLLIERLKMLKNKLEKEYMGNTVTQVKKDEKNDLNEKAKSTNSVNTEQSSETANADFEDSNLVQCVHERDVLMKTHLETEKADSLLLKMISCKEKKIRNLLQNKKERSMLIQKIRKEWFKDQSN